MEGKEVKPKVVSLKGKKDKKSSIKVGLLPLPKYVYDVSLDYFKMEREWYKYDVTHIFWKHIYTCIMRGHIIIGQVNGRVSRGKSTLGIHVSEEINRFMESKGILNPNFKGKYHELIFADQTEYWKKAKYLSYKVDDDTFLGCCSEIDENNKMIQTGMNSSINQIESEYKSDVFAQMKLHRIFCCPSGVIDHNVEWILEIDAPDKENKIGDAKLKYIMGDNKIITVGRVRFDVETTLKADYYEIYRKKKFIRMIMFDYCGVKDYRDFENNLVIMKTFEREKDFVLYLKMTRDDVTSAISDTLRHLSLNWTLLGVDVVASDVSKLLKEYKTIQENKIAISYLIDKGNIEKATGLKELNVRLQTRLDEKLEELETRESIRQEYDKIMTNIGKDEGKIDEFIQKTKDKYRDETNPFNL